MKTYRVGVACMSHDHVWGELRLWQQQPNVQLVAGGDDEPELLTKLEREFGVKRLYPSWQEMLDAEELDIVQIAGGNSESADIVEAAAQRGLHAVVEKPMAATLEQADRMLQAAERAGTLLLINWPTAWAASWQELERRALAGDIGEIRYVRYRSAHNGPIAIGCSPNFVRDLTTPEINGAGALMDYCCYGANLAARLLGRPEQVTGLRGVFGTEPAYAASDDNAVIVARYPHAFAVCEASWTQPVGYIETNPLLYGSEGALGVWHGKLILQRPGKPQETIEPPPTVAPRRSAPEYLLHCLENGQKPEGFCSAKVSRDAQEILEAGLRAANSGLHQSLPL
ncbi:Gfo/Idh/MocA family protein [Chthonomonas calidirosea]|uniref:Gfo/Idh/MocA family protein n=1 Tax=Chthonomonas calidirosea TaxID=454171 RepID=UPI00155A9612|nr:Gfo/Idh/MocA family oxidoreductase [Chthonomonas calidirosea]